MANKISSYQIVSATSTSGLQDIVEKFIKKGWTPQGGLAIAIEKAGFMSDATYHQVMVMRQ